MTDGQDESFRETEGIRFVLTGREEITVGKRASEEEHSRPAKHAASNVGFHSRAYMPTSNRLINLVPHSATLTPRLRIHRESHPPLPSLRLPRSCKQHPSVLGILSLLLGRLGNLLPRPPDSPVLGELLPHRAVGRERSADFLGRAAYLAIFVRYASA